MRKISLKEMFLTVITLYLIVIFIRSANASFILLSTLNYNFTTVEQGLIQGSYSLTEALSGFASGLLYEYLGPRKSLLTASIMLTVSYGLSNLIYYENIDPYLLILPQILGGFSASLIIVSSIALLAEETIYISYRRRLFGVGGLEASNLLGYGLGFFVGGLLEVFAPQATKGFILTLIFSSLAFLMSILLREKVREELVYKKFYRERFFNVERRSMYLVPMWAGVSIILGVAFISPRILQKIFHLQTGMYHPSFYHSSLGITLVTAVLLLSIAVLFGSFLSGYFGRERSLLIGSLSSIAAIPLIGVIISRPEIYVTRSFSDMLKLIFSDPLITFLVFSLILFGALAFMIPPTLLTLLAEFTDKTRVRGPSSGVYVTTLGIGIFIGNVLGGYIFDKEGILILSIVLSIIFAPLSLLTYFLLKYKADMGRRR